MGNFFFKYDFQHGFTQLNDDADVSVVLAGLRLPSFRECNNQLRKPSCYTDVCQNMNHGLPPACLNMSASILSTPAEADFPFYSAAIAIYTST